tara:strand:- start:225 stop:617 length:393 start_codon:yes stop_codon:yes gene_type:complete
MKSATLYIYAKSDASMSTMAVRVSLFPEIVESVPQRYSKHPLGKKIRNHAKEHGFRVWTDLVVFSSIESIPHRFEDYIVEGTIDEMEFGEGQIEGHFTTETICKEMKSEGWEIIAVIEVTEDWIELYFRR